MKRINAKQRQEHAKWLLEQAKAHSVEFEVVGNSVRMKWKHVPPTDFILGVGVCQAELRTLLNPEPQPTPNANE